MTEENAMAPLPWRRDVIERVLPHRDPFVWVSRIVAMRARRNHRRPSLT